MRNRFPGTCYRCGKRVEIGAGHFERRAGGWQTQHATCAVERRSKRPSALDKYAALTEPTEQEKIAAKMPRICP